MTIALSTKSKLYFVDGTLPRPQATSPNLKKWVRCNDMVMSWILNSLTKSIADSIVYAKTARDMWVDLDERFGQINGAKLYHVNKELSNVSQNTDDIAAYFTKIKSLWDELDDLDEVPPCSCDSAEKMKKREQNKRLLQFLMGLNDAYNTIRGNVLMMSPLPSISQVYSMLIQEEKQREIRSAGHFFGDSASLTAEFHKPKFTYKEGPERFDDKTSSRSEKFEGRRSSLFCNYCKKPGHSIEKCYRLHGFPANFKFRNQRRTAAATHSNSQETPAQEQPGIPGLSKEQYSQLVALIHNVQENQLSFPGQQAPPSSAAFSSFSGKSPVHYRHSLTILSSFSDWTHTWILDTGASDHMCHNKDFFC